MSVSHFSNRSMLKIGSMNGLDIVAAGAGIGALGGATVGAFSDYDTMLSGAVKGGLVGAPMGAGVKYLGSRYTKGFMNAHGSQATSNVLSGKAAANWNTDYLTKGGFGEKETFMGRYGI